MRTEQISCVYHGITKGVGCGPVKSMCLHIIKIWFWIAYGQMSSFIQELSARYKTEVGIIVSQFYFRLYCAKYFN